MIKRLQRRFVLIAVGSLAFVWLLLVGVIDLAFFIHTERTTDARLLVLAENEGKFPEKKKPSDFFVDREKKMNAEAPFDMRFFTVSLDEDGTVFAVNTGKIFAISTEDASAYAQVLFEKEKTKGYVDNYKYKRISLKEDPSKEMYIFLDCERELSTFRTVLVVSISASVAGLLLVFILVLIFSRMAMKPTLIAYEKQRRFITDASHEIKTPLTIIDANTELLEMLEGENEWTKSIRNQVQRLTQLTERMVFLSRMDEENSDQLTMLDFSLSDAVFEVAQPFEAVAQTKQKKLTLDIEEMLSFHGDEALLRQLISLLLDNALKYSNEGGEIRLSLCKQGRLRKLTVWNTVEQIEEGNQEVLFDRFYRTDASRSTKTGGSGIGLSVAKAIVGAHKGKIKARSEDGHSLTIEVLL